MSQKKTKQSNKHTVKEVLKSLAWSVEGGKLQLLSTITDEFVTIDIAVIRGRGGDTSTISVDLTSPNKATAN